MNGFFVSVSLIALTAAGAGWLGYEFRAGQDAKATLHQAARTVGVIERADQITQAAAISAEAGHDHIVTLTRTITKEIPSVLTPRVDRDFPLSVGFVRLHDAGALGLDLSAVPAPAGQSDDAASAVTSGALAQVITANYGACRDDQARLTELQGWLTQQEHTHEP